jgi:hypothetical protein
MPINQTIVVVWKFIIFNTNWALMQWLISDLNKYATKTWLLYTDVGKQ